MDTTRRELLAKAATGAVALAGAAAILTPARLAGQNANAGGSPAAAAAGDPVLHRFSQQYARLLRDHRANGRVATQAITERAVALHRTAAAYLAASGHEGRLRTLLASKSRDEVIGYGNAIDLSHVGHKVAEAHNVDISEALDRAGHGTTVGVDRRTTVLNGFLGGLSVATYVDVLAWEHERKIKSHTLPLAINNDGSPTIRRVGAMQEEPVELTEEEMQTFCGFNGCPQYPNGYDNSGNWIGNGAQYRDPGCDRIMAEIGILAINCEWWCMWGWLLPGGEAACFVFAFMLAWEYEFYWALNC